MGAWRATGESAPVRIYGRSRKTGAALVAIESRSHATAELETYLSTLRIEQRIRMGSSLKFCMVAEGTADIYPRFGPTMEWDVAAGDCIFRNSAREGQRESFLTYNKPDLRNDSFVLGDPHSDARLPAEEHVTESQASAF
jgi:3'(2'), 5'-bisphosphate nucleotidase